MRWLVYASLFAIFLPNPSLAQEKPRRPNVVFLFSDDQRADTIAALGNTHIKTPNLDKLVMRGIAFTHAYCMGAMQGAVCVPSRAMVMSGRSLFKIDQNLKGITTWPAMFARMGYRTFITGKWHNQEASALAAFMEGKSIFFGGMGDPFALPVADITPKHTLTEKKLSGKHSVELFADNAIDFIKKQKGADKPFVAYVAFNGPHDPRTAPKEYHAPYDKNKPPLPPNFLPVHPFNNGPDITGRDERLAPWPRTPEIVRQHLADYYAYITFLDAQVGRIVEALREAGLEDDTIIVFASDHGLAIGSHGLFGKQNLYDCSMRAPLIFAGPGIPKGKQSDTLCYLFDIFPTLGDLAKVAGPEGSEGKSLVPVMKGRTKGRDSLFTAYRQFQRGVRDDRWHLIVYPQINKTQLFDLANDPHELKDLAADPTHAKTIDRLTGKLKDWQQKLGDTQPLRSEKPTPLEFDFSKVPPEKKKKASPGLSAVKPWDHQSALIPTFERDQSAGRRYHVIVNCAIAPTATGRSLACLPTSSFRRPAFSIGTESAPLRPLFFCALSHPWSPYSLSWFDGIKPSATC